MNFVPCVTWVKRGVAKEIPDKVQLSKAELKKLIEESITDIKDLTVGDDDGEHSEPEGAAASTEKMEDDIEEEEDLVAKYNLDTYDDENTRPVLSFGQLVELPSENKESEDPQDENENDKAYDSDDEYDYKIQPRDNIIAVGHVTEDCSVLEVYVYNEDEDDLYVHHDLVLPAFPVCLETLHYGPNEDRPSNYLAVGDMTPVINIWDLDMVDIIEPVAKLGKKMKKKERKKLETSGEHGHIDAVLDLSWNTHLCHALASGSADETVILWDLSTCTPVTHLRHHSEKVQCVEWHPFEAELLLTGSCDKQVSLYDARSIEQKMSWSLNEEIERLLWNQFDPFCFLAGTDQGNIYCFDARQSVPLFTIDAHNKEISDMSLSSCPGLLVSTGSFTSVKVWDIRNHQPQLVASKKLKEGNLLACRCSPDSPFIFAIGGDKPSSNFKVLDLLKTDAVRSHFAPENVERQSATAPESTLDSSSGAASGSVQAQIVTSTESVLTGKKASKKKTLSKKSWK